MSLTDPVLEQQGSFELIGEAEFARLIGRRPASLEEIVGRQSVFFIEDGGQLRYLSFFVDPQYRRRDLYAASRKLGPLSGGTKLQFFTLPKASIWGITPLVALQRGMTASVLRSAEGFKQR